MEWRGEGFVLKVAGHGETSALVEVMTREHGRHAGIVRGGVSRRARPHLQPGNRLDLTWRARLAEHLGSFTFEPVASSAAMSSRLALAGVNAITALLSLTLPERDAHPALYDQSLGLLALLGEAEMFPLAYLRWEGALLSEMGFGLDLSVCAVTGSREDLAYVSPRSGRAVSRQGAGDWAPKLLALPPILLGRGAAGPVEILAGLAITGWFIEHRLLAGTGETPLPSARARLLAEIGRGAA